mgnify:CR=1 FL=1
MASKSHKDNVKQYNEYLEKLSEHNDIPRVRHLIHAFYGLCILTYLPADWPRLTTALPLAASESVPLHCRPNIHVLQ